MNISSQQPTLAKQPQLELERVVSKWQITAYGLGGIIGAGIFAVIGTIAGTVGKLAPLAFLLAAIPAFLAAITYSALVVNFPKAGGEASYVQKAFSVRSLTLIITFLVAASGLVSSAALAVAFGGYLAPLLSVPDYLMVILVIVGAGAISAIGTNLSVATVVTITIIEVSALVLIIASGLPEIASYSTELPTYLQDLKLPGQLVALSSAAVLAFFAFIGFEDMVNMAEEVKEPEKNMPTAIFVAFALSILIYMAVAMVAVETVDPKILATTSDPLNAVASEQGVFPPVLISLFALVAISNGLLIQINMVSRLLYGVAKLKALPHQLAYISPKTKTPLISIILITIAIGCLSLLLPFVSLTNATSILLLFIFSCIHITAIKLKRDGKLRAYKLSMWVPISGLTLSVAMILFWLFS